MTSSWADKGEDVDTEKVHVPEERKSYLSTIYGKALDARAEHPILGDRFAEDAIRRIDFDFDKLAVGGDAAITLPMRAKFFDDWTREFLDAYPRLDRAAPGLRSRHPGLPDRPSADRPLVRRRPPRSHRTAQTLYPERPGYEMIATSVADLQWLDSIPGETPVLVVAEGLVQYLPVDDRGALFNRITEQFPSGEIIFDAYGRATLGVLSLVLRLQRTGLRLYGPIKDGHEIEEQVPRLRLVSAVSFLTLPEMVPLLIHSKAQGWLYRRMERWKWYRNSMQHFRYEF